MPNTILQLPLDLPRLSIAEAWENLRRIVREFSEEEVRVTQGQTGREMANA